MYEALGNMGLKQGNILEPSCGVGNFMGLLPENTSNANMYGVELDPISGQIAKQLYQKNRIAVQGFEETSYQLHRMAPGYFPVSVPYFQVLHT